MSTFIISNGDLYACGENKYGQLGLNDFENRNVFVRTNITSHHVVSFNAIAYLDRVTIVLDSDGNLWGCGDNSFSQLGLGPESHGTFVKIFVKIPCGDVQFTNIACTDIHCLAMDTDGNLWNAGNFHGVETLFTKIDCNGAVFTSICCGIIKGYAIDNEANLWVCDYQHNPNIFVKILTTSKFKTVASGRYHHIALDIDGNFWAAGSNEYGQLGVRDIKSVESLHQITHNVEFTAIACGSDHTVALDIDGNLWSCGCNHNDQLGRNCAFFSESLIKIMVSASDILFTSVSCGDEHTVALDIDGNLWTCGNNTYGQLGLSDNFNRNRLTQVPNLKADILFNQQIKPKTRIKSAASMI